MTPTERAAIRARAEGASGWHNWPNTVLEKRLVRDVLALDAELTRVEQELVAAQSRPAPMWPCPILEHGACAELCFQCCLDLVTESLQEVGDERDRLREENARLHNACQQALDWLDGLRPRSGFVPKGSDRTALLELDRARNAIRAALTTPTGEES